TADGRTARGGLAAAGEDRADRPWLVRVPAQPAGPRRGQLLDSVGGAGVSRRALLAVLLQAEEPAQRDLRLRLVRALRSAAGLAGLGVLRGRQWLLVARGDGGAHRADPCADEVPADAAPRPDR